MKQVTDRIHPVGAALGLCSLIAVAVLFNVYPDRVGTYVSADDASTFRPLLALRFQDYLPMLNLWWGAGMALCVVQLFVRRWTPGLRWASLGVRFLGGGVLLSLARGAPFLGSHTLVTLVTVLLGVFGGLSLFGAVVDFMRMLLRGDLTPGWAGQPR